MAKDKYSDSHTIDVFNDEQQFSIYTTGLNSPIEIKAGDPEYTPTITYSDIVLNAKDDIHIYADDYIQLFSDKVISIVTRDDESFPTYYPSSGAWSSYWNDPGDIAISAHDDLFLTADSDILMECGDGVAIYNNSAAGQAALIVNNTDTAVLTRYILKLQAGGTSQVHVNNQGDLTALGEIKCANFQMTSGASNGYYLVSDGDGDASWSEVDNAVIDWGSVEADSFAFTADTSITIEMENSGNPLKLIRHSNDVNVDDQYYAEIKLHPAGQIALRPTDDLWLLTPEGKITYIRGDMSDSTSTESHVCHIRNESDSAYADCLKLSIGKATPGSDNFWLTFNSDCSLGTSAHMEDGNLRGRVRGSDNGWGTETTGATVAFQTPSVDDISLVEIVTVGDRGNCVYASGDSDFGEWFECGDPYEWFQNIEDVEKKMRSKRAYLDLPEGIVVYVRDKKFYRSQPGVPMITTHRALLVGNERPDSQEKPGWLGQILSFVGQVPVYFSGEAKSGDFLIDSGEGYCVPVSPEDVTMKEYVKTIGRALEDAGSTKQRRVMCAINYK